MMSNINAMGNDAYKLSEYSIIARMLKSIEINHSSSKRDNNNEKLIQKKLASGSYNIGKIIKGQSSRKNNLQRYG